MKRRKGAVETISFSVDAQTKRTLKLHADRLFDGSMSALITAFAREAERRDALDWLIRDLGGSSLTDELRKEILAEHRAKKPTQRKKRAT